MLTIVSVILRWIRFCFFASRFVPLVSFRATKLFCDTDRRPNTECKRLFQSQQAAIWPLFSLYQRTHGLQWRAFFPLGFALAHQLSALISAFVSVGSVAMFIWRTPKINCSTRYRMIFSFFGFSPFLRFTAVSVEDIFKHKNTCLNCFASIANWFSIRHRYEFRSVRFIWLWTSEFNCCNSVLFPAFDFVHLTFSWKIKNVWIHFTMEISNIELRLTE